MTFVSLNFVVFFPTVAVLYYLTPQRFRWALLLAASCIFYMAFVPAYIFVLFALILIDYTTALLIERSSGIRRTHYLLVSVASMLAMLIVFKYFNFFNANLSALAQFLGWHYSYSALNLLLPLGLSFHTFQSLSYVIEVYRGNYKAERHLGFYALYVMFFPQLIAGPIERPAHLLPQLKNPVSLNAPMIASGLRLMLWGFFKKVVIADRVGLGVNYVWSNVAHLPGPSIAAAILFFSVQLYADFSGYSDIARGSARVLGIDVIQNFAQPYFSSSIPEFWRRWHISLSSWFRDYFFTPLALKWRNVYLTTIVTFLVLGLWHGANWTYVVMGGLHGVYISLSLLTKKVRQAFTRAIGLTQVPRLHRALRVAITFSLSSVSWVFFRAPSMAAAGEFLEKLFSNWNFSTEGLVKFWQYPFERLGLNHADLMAALGAMALLFAVEYAQMQGPLNGWFLRRSPFMQAFICAGMVLAIAVYGELQAAGFIYFQF